MEQAALTGQKAIAELQSVSNRFGYIVTADDLNLPIHEGEFLSFPGPSRCSKTTTLRMLAGYEESSDGDVLLDGEVVNDVQDHHRDHNKYDVRFNSLCLDFVDTPFDAGIEAQMGGRNSLETYIANAVPMGRCGAPQEIAHAIVFLASDISSFMTGHALVIDVGKSIP